MGSGRDLSLVAIGLPLASIVHRSHPRSPRVSAICLGDMDELVSQGAAPLGAIHVVDPRAEVNMVPNGGGLTTNPIEHLPSLGPGMQPHVFERDVELAAEGRQQIWCQRPATATCTRTTVTLGAGAVLHLLEDGVVAQSALQVGALQRLVRRDGRSLIGNLSCRLHGTTH
jgi:hypothetical protein